MDSMIVTTADFNEDKYKLLQLNPEIEQAITTGSKVFIVGARDTRAVICTENKSYFIKKEDTSNLRLLTTHTDWSGSEETMTKRTIQVSGAARFHYLLEHKVPDVTQLRALLLESPYVKPRHDATESHVKRVKLHKLYTTGDLVGILQVSEHEVLKMLKEIHAFEEAGAWRLLELQYQTQVFTDMLDTIFQHDWDVLSEPGVPLKQFLTELDEPMVAIRQCCKLYGLLTLVNGEDHCTLNPVKVATFRAKSLFDEQIEEAKFQAQHEHVKPADAGWELDQFMEKWKLRVPDSVTVSLEMLCGLVLVKPQGAGKPTRIVYFPEEDLSPDPKKRFEQLFNMQEKWTIKQLEPYIKCVVSYAKHNTSVIVAQAHTLVASRQIDRKAVQQTMI
ncbi:hypothetical protein DD237_000815 [Peronospora effusa]|uniref:Sister chromatid cohesion protein DCC1 n=1 Tax=Peronospora effusa TaxID=542832 RepID=A0A425C2J8_9STRA|nr:hypothetical protein DD237_000815 [Peronospora effusa]